MNEWNLDARQRNTLEYFRQHAADWRQRAEADRERRVSTIGQRNDQAIRLVESRPGQFKTALDLGCGTGELVFELARRSVEGMGVDFSDKMVDLCREKADRLGLAGQCRFEVGSVPDYDYGTAQFDLVTAFGFIEYLRPEQLAGFFALCRRLVAPGGALQVGSRNRLFNIVSLNQFTQAEIDAGTTAELLQEAVWLAQADTLDGYLEQAMAVALGQDVLREYPQTDVDVAGYQYTPAAICRLLQEAGFRVAALAPVHYHGFIPAIARVNTKLHAGVSNLVHERFPDEFRLVPYSSSYILTAG